MWAPSDAPHDGGQATRSDAPSDTAEACHAVRDELEIREVDRNAGKIRAHSRPRPCLVSSARRGKGVAGERRVERRLRVARQTA